MKRIIKTLFVGVLALSLAACGGGSKPEDKKEATGGDAKKYNIGVAIYKYDDTFMTSYRNALAEIFEEQGKKDGNTYALTVQDGKNDQAEQGNQIDTFITQGVDLIIANLVDPVTSEQVIEKANKADIPVIFINREPEEAVLDAAGGKATYVGSDALQSGNFQGEIISELDNHGDYNGNGKLDYIMIQGDVQNIDAKERTQGSIEKYEELNKDIPVNKLVEQRGDWDRAKGQEIAASALTQYGKDIDVIFCNNDDMALGAVQAIEAAGRKVGEDIAVVGVDALPETLTLIEEGKFTGTVKNDAKGQASKVVEVALKALNGDTLDTHYWVPYIKITKENLAEHK